MAVEDGCRNANQAVLVVSTKAYFARQTVHVNGTISDLAENVSQSVNVVNMHPMKQHMLSASQVVNVRNTTKQAVHATKAVPVAGIGVAHSVRTRLNLVSQSINGYSTFVVGPKNIDVQNVIIRQQNGLRFTDEMELTP